MWAKYVRPEYTSNLRSFIAIELSEVLKKALAEFQQELGKCGADVRWVRPDNIHLTLKFLGNIEEDKADAIAEKIKGTCKGQPGFELAISGAGVFPGKRSPRVLWAGIVLNDNIMTLQEGIEEAMASLGFEREKRRFSPHLTLGRFRSSRGKQAVLDKIIDRVTTDPAIFLQPGFLGDVVVISEEDGTAKYYTELRLDYIPDSPLSKNEHYYTISLEYGHFKGDPFNIERDPNPAKAHEANYLHPIIRRYQNDQLVTEHHIHDDLENDWAKEEYVQPALTFFKAQLKLAPEHI